jgi:hypothetical protein
MTPPPSTSVRRHRAPGDPGAALAALGSRLGVAALVLAALAIGGPIIAAAPSPDTQNRPFVRSGKVGERVDARVFDATVVSVRGAAQLARSGTAAHDTAGIWVLVTVRLVAHTEPVSVGYAAVRDERGRIYWATNRIDQPLIGGRVLQPGVPVQGELAFEVPKPVATQLTVRLAWHRFEQRLDAMVEVPLPIDAAAVQRWSDQKPVTLADPKPAS